MTNTNSASPSREAQAFLEYAFYGVNCDQILTLLKQQVFSRKELQLLKSQPFRELSVIESWRRLRPCSIPRAIIEIPHSLGAITDQKREWLLREIGEPSDSDGIVGTAIESGALVLMDGPRSAFWQGIEIDVSWDRHPALWEFLQVLARQTKCGGVLDYMKFGEASAAMPKHRKHALGKLPEFPSSLLERVTSAGRGSYRLELDHDQIRIFEATGDEKHEEWHP